MTSESEPLESNDDIPQTSNPSDTHIPTLHERMTVDRSDISLALLIKERVEKRAEGFARRENPT